MSAMTIRLPDETYERLRQDAFDKRTSMNALIIEALKPRVQRGGGCDQCGKPHTHVTTPGGFRFCDEHGRRARR